MKLDTQLSGAISTIEMILEKLSAKEEFCISDIEVKLHEWRSDLYTATHGNDPLFALYEVYDVTIGNADYRFMWPNDAYDHIRTFYVSDNVLYATSVSIMDLRLEPNGEITRSPIHEGTTVIISPLQSQSHWIEAGKTNLTRV